MKTLSNLIIFRKMRKENPAGFNRVIEAIRGKETCSPKIEDMQETYGWTYEQANWVQDELYRLLLIDGYWEEVFWL